MLLEHDTAIRLAMFDWLRTQTELLGEVLPRTLLANGFSYQNQHIPLVSPQGIFTPRVMELPLTITTTVNSIYDDEAGNDGIFRYKYRGTDPMHRDNRGLKQLMLKGLPLVYFHGLVPGQYLPISPVYIVGADDSALEFMVSADQDVQITGQRVAVADDRTDVRAYVTQTVQRRLHQLGFREKVMKAYRRRCSICNLAHPELLDAAHIIPDSHPDGHAVLPNGISLCKIHHAAYDRNVMGISPDYRVRVREDILEEIDGPMLEHGIKEMDNRTIILPRAVAERPLRENLDFRFQQFLSI